jgi:hypothetical protein
MSATNGYHRDDYPTLQRKLKEARARQRLARLEAETQLLEGFGAEPGLGFPTSWFDPFDLARFGWGVGGQAAGGAWNAGSRAARQDGGNHPFFWTETDLERSRGLARWLATKNMLAVGALNTLRNFTVKTGFKWEAQPAPGWTQDPVAKELAAQVQACIDEFSDTNRLPQRERSAFLRSRRDGEVFCRFFDQGDGTTLFRFVLPEQVRQPLGSPPEWSYGIETEPQDVETPVSYAVHYHPDPDEWEQVPAAEVAHLKLNVDEEIKRGLSDFYCTAEAFDQTDKLLRNMRVTGGIQSAIGWFERFTNLSSDALSQFAGKRKDLNRPQIQHPISGRDLNYEHMEPGQIRLINGNREMLPAPLAQNTTQHISIAQASMRALGVRWNAPEFMISGDASNNNFASILVAGSPFVNSIECEQDDYRWYFLRWRWVAVKNAARARRFVVGGRAYGIEDVARLVDLHATPPQVAIANKQAEAAVDHQDLAARVTSLQALRAKRGYDNDKIRQDLAEEPPTAVAGRVTDVDPAGNPLGGGGGRPVAGAGPIQVRRGGKTFLRRRARESLLEGFTGTVTDKLGRVRHYVDGKQVKSQEDVNAALSGTKDTGPVAGTKTAAAAPASIADAYQRLQQAQGGGRVKVPDLFDAAKEANPGLTLEAFHQQLLDLEAQDLLSIGQVNDPRLEPRYGEMIPDPRGQTRLGYILLRPGALEALRSVRESRVLLEAGFTGVIKDKLGRERHYVDGKQVKGPSLEHGYSREEVHAMSPAQRKSLLGLAAGISPKGKTDEEIRDILSPPEKAPAVPEAPAPESKLPPAEHKAALASLLAAKQKGEAQGGFDPRGDLARLPPPEKTAAVRSDVLAIVGEHVKRTTVGIPINRLYDQLAQQHDLSPEEFRAVLLDAYQGGKVELGGWPRTLDDLPRPDLVPLVSGTVKGTVHLPSR